MTNLKSIPSKKTGLIQSSLDFGTMMFTLSGTDSLGEIVISLTEIVMPYVKGQGKRRARHSSYPT